MKRKRDDKTAKIICIVYLYFQNPKKKKKVITLNSYVIWLEFTLHVCMWFEKCQLTTNRKIKRKEKKISYYKGSFEYNLFLLKLKTEN